MCFIVYKEYTMYRFRKPFTYFVNNEIYEGQITVPCENGVHNINVECEHNRVKSGIQICICKLEYQNILKNTKRLAHKTYMKEPVYCFTNEEFWLSEYTKELDSCQYVIRNKDKIKDWDILTLNISNKIILETINLCPWSLTNLLSKPNTNHFDFLQIMDEEKKRELIKLMENRLEIYRI